MNAFNFLRIVNVLNEVQTGHLYIVKIIVSFLLIKMLLNNLQIYVWSFFRVCNELYVQWAVTLPDNVLNFGGYWLEG